MLSRSARFSSSLFTDYTRQAEPKLNEKVRFLTKQYPAIQSSAAPAHWTDFADG